MSATLSTTVQREAASAARAAGRRSAHTAGFIVLAAAWFGLITAFGELAALAAGRLIRGFIGFEFGWDLVRLSPIANLLLFAGIGTVAAAGFRLLPRIFTLKACLTLFALLTALSGALYFDRRVHVAALLVASLGIAVQAGRLLAPRAAGFARLVRATFPPLLGLALAAAVGVTGARWLAERHAIAGLPQARPGAPNVILLILDTVRAMNLSLYGYDRNTTPNLDSIARGGVVFDWAMAPAPWTLPSHATMFTGRHPFEHMAYFRRPLDGTYPTLAEVLRANGYVTAGFVANTFMCPRPTGLARGFIHYEDLVASPGTILNSTPLARGLLRNRTVRHVLGYYDVLGRKWASDVQRDFLDWQSRNGSRPFFAFLNYFDAHAPYLPPPAFADRFGVPGQRKYLVLEERYIDADRPEVAPYIPSELAAYDASLAYLDEQLRHFFDELDRRGLLENTIIIISSDHGEEFGEHGRMGHAYNLHTSLLHVPLIVLAPGRAPAGVRVETPVGLSDLPATILELAGIQTDALPGRPLSRFWRGDSLTAEPSILSSEWSMVSLVNGGFHYIREEGGREHIYDYRLDPLEQRNLAASPDTQALVERFRAEVPALFFTGGPGSGPRPVARAAGAGTELAAVHGGLHAIEIAQAAARGPSGLMQPRAAETERR